jgi:hypothetical protein
VHQEPLFIEDDWCPGLTLPVTAHAFLRLCGCSTCVYVARTRIGDDERLKGNIHGIVFFVHGGEKYLAVAQNSDERVLILQLNGVVKQELAKPAGTEFAFQEVNDYYKQYGEGEKGKV